MFKKLIVTTCCLLVLVTDYSQSVFTNNDGMVHIDSSAVLYVEGDVLVENSGVIENSGTIFVQNDWTNNSQFNVFLNSLPGLVHFFGGNQSVKGTTPTLFHKVETSNSAVKSIEVETWVEQELVMNNSQIQLNAQKLHLFNPDPTSLKWNNGFIAGDSIGGYFLRSVNQSQLYWFPVGNERLLNTYRAVSFLPTTADSSVIGVRLAAENASFDYTGIAHTGAEGPYSFDNRIQSIAAANTNFYHHITSFYGKANGVSNIYYFNSDEIESREFNSVAQWNEARGKWKMTEFSPFLANQFTAIQSPDNVMTIQSLDFENEVYALAIRRNKNINVPQIFSPNNDGVNDVLLAYGDDITKFQFVIYNRWGQKVFESNDPSVGWDGRHNGADAQPGVYVYIVSAEIEDIGPVSNKGDITLVR